MIIKNVSTKIIGLGPDQSLLPDCETEVDDTMKDALEAYIGVGFLEVKESKAREIDPEEEPVAEKPKSRKKK